MKYDYELTLLFRPELEDETKLNIALDWLRLIIENNGGKITKEENDGKKRLAYEILGQEYAVYYYIEFSLKEKNNGIEICNAMNIADPILRYLLVPKDRK